MIHFSCKPYSSLRRAICTGVLACAGLALCSADEPLPLSTSYWKDPAFLKAFNGSYRIEARIEPTLSTKERGLLVKVQDLMAQGKREEALAALKASELTKNSAALTYNLGNLQFELGETEKAIEAYQSALKEYPSFRRAHRNLAMAHVRAEEWDKALASLNEAVRLGDSEGMTYGLLGYCRLAREDYASALQAYRLAQLTEPDVADWSAGIAQCLQQLDQRKEAVALLDEVIRKRPLESSYAVLQANIHLQLQQEDEAAKALEFANRVGTLTSDSKLLLAELHLSAGRMDESKSVMEAAFAMEEKPSESSVHRLLQLAVIQQQWLLAKDLMQRIPKTMTGRSLQLTKAKYLIESGEDAEAGMKVLEKLAKQDPTDGQVLLALADQVAASGQPNAADLIYQRAAADEAWAFRAYSSLTRLRAAEGRYTEALDSLDKALKIKADSALEDYRKALVEVIEAAR